jgi:hypothetical protein
VLVVHIKNNIVQPLHIYNVHTKSSRQTQFFPFERRAMLRLQVTNPW